MTLRIRQSEVADRIGDVLDILADDTAGLDDWAAAYAIAQQLRLRLDRSLKSRRDDLIVGMERGGMKALGPLTIKSAAVDPRYIVNEPENHGDSTLQEALREMRADPTLREFIRYIPEHFEIDVEGLTEGIRLGSQRAMELYGEMNRRGWRVERDRRKSLAVREAVRA
jgi:hypothetical protein